MKLASSSKAPSSTPIRQGTLAALDTKNPLLYIDFPEGRLKFFGTLVFPRNRYLVLRLGQKDIICEDVLENMVRLPDPAVAEAGKRVKLLFVATGCQRRWSSRKPGGWARWIATPRRSGCPSLRAFCRREPRQQVQMLAPKSGPCSLSSGRQPDFLMAADAAAAAKGSTEASTMRPPAAVRTPSC